jgi:hypothetical protein
MLEGVRADGCDRASINRLLVDGSTGRRFRTADGVMQVLINVDVDDLGKATHFYTTAFGLKVSRRFGVEGVEMLGRKLGADLPARQGGRHSGLRHYSTAPQL